MGSGHLDTGQWVSQARFDHAYGRTGVDHDFGTGWGPHRNQRVSLRLAPGQAHGVLYVYDPLWNEYNLLDHSATLDETARAFTTVATTLGVDGVGVDALADAVRREQLRPLLEATLEPRTGRDLGIQL
jgi:hypothetical protein